MTGRRGTTLADFLDGLPKPSPDRLYRELVLPLRARRLELGGTAGRTLVSATLLGWQVRVGRWRKDCPDRETAEYLGLYASLGGKSILAPYRFIDTARILPALKESFEALQAAVACRYEGSSSRRRQDFLRRVRRLLVKRLAEIDAGWAPEDILGR